MEIKWNDVKESAPPSKTLLVIATRDGNTHIAALDIVDYEWAFLFCPGDTRPEAQYTNHANVTHWAEIPTWSHPAGHPKAAEPEETETQEEAARNIRVAVDELNALIEQAYSRHYISVEMSMTVNMTSCLTGIFNRLRVKKILRDL